MNTTNEQTHEHLAKRVLGRINDEHLTPRPRWEFILKNYALWGVGILAVALGALAFSAILFEIQNVDWRLSPATHTDGFSFFFATAPFIWVLALALFTLVGYLYVRRTKHGYRYPLVVIAFSAVLLSVACGSGLYLIGFGGEVEESIGDHPPFYRPILVEERSWWLAPDKGLLGGEVAEVAPHIDTFMLRDFSGHVWTIETNDLRNRDLAVIARGGTVRVIGTPATSTDAVFHACFVFPWTTRGGYQREPFPPPFAVVASTTGKRAEDRSDACQGIRPYQQLHNIEDSW
jgi:hypothetical protein